MQFGYSVTLLSVSSSDIEAVLVSVINTKDNGYR